MKRRFALLPLLALCACSGAPRPVLIDDVPGNSDADDAAAERRAAEALRDIQGRIERGDLPKIQFEFDQDRITPESYPTLDLVAQAILADDHLKLLILAHTDNVGTEAYNIDLSQRRANSVRTYLAIKGVPLPSMRSKGYGFSRPIADNATDEGRALNRRVEFRVTTRDWRAVY